MIATTRKSEKIERDYNIKKGILCETKDEDFYKFGKSGVLSIFKFNLDIIIIIYLYLNHYFP